MKDGNDEHLKQYSHLEIRYGFASLYPNPHAAEAQQMVYDGRRTHLIADALNLCVYLVSLPCNVVLTSRLAINKGPEIK